MFRIAGIDRRNLEVLLFRRYPHAEWGTFFRFGYRITPWGLHVTFVESLEPGPGDLDLHSNIVEFSARYILRAQLHLGSTTLGIGVIHSHPEDCGTGASPLDEDMDRYFHREFFECSEGRPYVSVRLARHSDGRFRFSGEAWVGGEVLPITELLTIGEELSRQTALPCSAIAIDAEVEEYRARYVELVGDRVGRLRQATIGVVGCSGLGSPAVHVLVRAGVRRFVLIDPKLFDPSNLERMHGSNRQDVDAKLPKTEILGRLIHEIDPGAEVTMIRGNVLHDHVLDELLKCDLVLGCTDSQHSRAALGDFASHYLLPCLKH